ncbi:MAG TPA: N-acetyl-gamma-glutamyl-phosphate reductase [Alphaproteobacteria bacterium]|nr:N-acetyl-gamma-glutamyl-phosphate reductase [Alphaproteobacteria bacterium]
MSKNPANIAILGASGYTGAELVRLLSRHPDVRIAAVTADRKAGEDYGSVFPHLAGLGLPALVSIDQLKWDQYDLIFCGLPHGTTQEVIAAIPRNKKVVDLSADFRLRDLAAYEKWYGHAHRAPELQSEAVFGLTEFYRKEITRARLVACPGCYPTSALLPLVPLLSQKMIETGAIIVDSKSGVSGAGRALKEGSLFSEVSEAIHAYGVANHRHMSELDQELSLAAGAPVLASFTPHLVPMNRGILSTIYVQLAGANTAADIHAALAGRYAAEPFVRVLPIGEVPATRHVRGTNHALIGVVADRRPGRAIIVSVIDNLVKGASGQGVQNMNLMLGLDETAGLMQEAIFP